MQQHGLTIVVPIIDGRKNDLQVLLNAIGNDIDGNKYIDFYVLSTVHFLRWVILPEEEVNGHHIGAQLALSTNFDGDPKIHLAELIAKAKVGIKAIYAHCFGFPFDGSNEEIMSYFLKYKVANAAFYCGTVGRSVAQIHKERQLRYGIQSYLQSSNPSQNWAGQAPNLLRRQFVHDLQSQSEFAWTKQRYQPTFLYRNGRLLLAVSLGLILGLVTALLFLQPLKTALAFLFFSLIPVFWFSILRYKEGIDKANFVAAPRNAERLADLTAREDYRIQNQITHLVAIKPGWFRLLTLKFVLKLINLLASTFFNRGNLAGIPSIHFARWAIIDGGKRLLFFSNFDGSWESYLGDFIDKAAVGLTAVWTNTVGFPPTEKLIYSGARNSVDFKAWVRDKQIQTQVWYSAYKTLSVQNINCDTEIRKGMIGEMNASKSLEWLQKL